MIINKLYNEDCLNFLTRVPDNYFDLVIADPPYFEICGEFDYAWEDVHAYLRWCQSWILEIHRTLKKTGSFFLWGAMGFNKGFALPRLAYWMEDKKLFHVNNWITQRNSRGRGMKKGFMQAREELLFLVFGDEFTWNTAYTNEKSLRTDLGANGKPRSNEFKRCSDVWIDIAEASQSSNERFHTSDGKAFPTVKPIKASNRIIECSSNKDDLVFIPFAGSGTEIISCMRLQRNWVACEVNKHYIDEIILPRISKG